MFRNRVSNSLNDGANQFGAAFANSVLGTTRDKVARNTFDQSADSFLKMAQGHKALADSRRTKLPKAFTENLFSQTDYSNPDSINNSFDILRAAREGGRFEPRKRELRDPIAIGTPRPEPKEGPSVFDQAKEATFGVPSILEQLNKGLGGLNSAKDFAGDAFNAIKERGPAFAEGTARFGGGLFDEAKRAIESALGGPRLNVDAGLVPRTGVVDPGVRDATEEAREDIGAVFAEAANRQRFGSNVPGLPQRQPQQNGTLDDLERALSGKSPNEIRLWASQNLEGLSPTLRGLVEERIGKLLDSKNAR